MPETVTPAAAGKTIWDVFCSALTLIQNLVDIQLANQTAELSKINARLTELSIQIQENQDVTQKQFDDVIDTLDTATSKGALVANAIKDQIKALRDAIAGQGLPAATEQAILDRLTASATAAGSLADALTAMATDPGNPVPVPVPDPPPPGPPPTA